MKKRFYITLILSLLIAALPAWAFFAIVTKGMGNTLKDKQGKLNDLMQGNQPCDVLFIGSSRVFIQVNANLFDSLCGTNSYNGGIDGAAIAEMEVITRHYLKSHPSPKYIFIGVDEKNLMNTEIWEYPRFFPYLKDKDVAALSRYQKEMLLARYLPPVALTYYDDPKKIQGILAIRNKGDLFYKKTKGFNDAKKDSVTALSPAKDADYNIDSDGMRALNHIIEMCIAHNAKPIVCITPFFKEDADNSVKHNNYLEKLNSVLKPHNVPCLDYSADSTFFNRKYYRDGTHLNKAGAYIFTQKLAREFKRMVQDTTAAN